MTVWATSLITDMAGYEVPVHADIPKQEVIFLMIPTPSPPLMKAKGVGELGPVRRERGYRQRGV